MFVKYQRCYLVRYNQGKVIYKHHAELVYEPNIDRMFSEQDSLMSVYVTWHDGDPKESIQSDSPRPRGKRNENNMFVESDKISQ